MILICILYYFNFEKGLIVVAKNSIESFEILDNELIEFDDIYLDDFLSNINMDNYKEFFVEDRVIIEGYTASIIDYITVGDKKINIQISISDGKCLVGSPVIKNSF